MTGPEPPRLARRIAQAWLPATFRDAVLGDWAEEFAADCAQGHRVRAHTVYWLHLLSPNLLRLRRVASELAHSRRGPSMHDSRRPARRVVPDGTVQDLRVAARSLLRDRVFTSTVVLVLGLGLGVATSVFSIMNGVLLRPLAYQHPEQLVAIWGERAAERIDRTPLTVWDIVNLRANATTLADVAAFFQTGSALQSDGPPTEVGFGWMTDNTLRVMGIEPMLGRGFTEDDNGRLVVLLDHDIWRARFGADSTIIGKSIRLAQQQWTVIGVLPPGKPLQLPNRGFLPQHTDIWTLVSIPVQDPDATFGWMRVVGRLAPGATVDLAQEELHVLAAAARERFPERDDAGFGLQVVGLLEDFTTQAALPLRLLAAGAIVLLAIVFINTANLILLRASLRRHAVAIRSVLGAGRRRIARPAIMEGAMLSAAGMGFGLLMASFVIGLIRTAPPPGMPRVDNLAIDGSVIGFAAVCASIATIAFGIIPGAMIARRSLEGVLRARTGGARPMRHVGAFVVAEVALSVALLVSAGLLVRTTARMADVDPGFEPERVLTFRVSLPNVDMSVEQVAGVARELEERVEALPGALSAGLVHALPLSGTLATGPYALTVGELGEADTGPQINYRYASPGYLPTIRARLIAGRHLDGRDPQSSVVIDTELAQTLWRGASAIGRQFAADPMQRGAELFTVVGVVESMHHESIREPGTATAYFSARYYTPPYLWATVRTDGNPAGLVQPIQRTLPEIHADLAMARVGTMNDLLRDATADTRWVMWTMTVFGIAAAVLSAIGLYGTLGHLVSGRMREIGIRLALGARRAQVMALVMRSALLLVGLGLLAGIVASLWISGSLESLLFGISPVDPLSYLAGTAALGLLTGVAAWIPAVRATRVSPTETLREE